MKRVYIRIIGLMLCLPFIYALYLCAGIQLASLILLCVLGGSSLGPFVVAALVIGLYLVISCGKVK